MVVLIVVFAGGALLSSGQLTNLLDFAIGMSVAEMKGQYAPDVTAAQKQSLDAGIQQMLKNLREERLSLPSLQPFLELLRQASGDGRITTAEAAKLEELVQRINARAKVAKPATPRTTL